MIRYSGRVSHNELWRIIQFRFTKKDDIYSKGIDSFSNKTFEKTLKLMVDEGLIFKELDKTSKLKKVWYFIKWDKEYIKNEVIRNFVNVASDKEFLKNYETKFSNLNNYDRASNYVHYNTSFLLTEASLEKLSTLYPDSTKLKTELKQILKLRKRLDNLISKLNTKDKNEIYQLIIRNQYNLGGEILGRVNVIDWI